MSRVGKKPIAIPGKVQVTYQNRFLSVKGSKGTLSRPIHEDVDLQIKDGVIQVAIPRQDARTRALQGLTRSLVDSMLICLVSEGHVLVEGMPGLAKTTAVKSLGEAIEGDYHRVQFTPDLLPSDLVGTDIYRHEKGRS